MKIPIKYLKKIDFISNKYSFEHNDSSIYQTYQGAFFSLVVLITSLVLTLMFGKEIYKKELPIVNNSLEAAEDSTIYLSKFPIFFSLYSTTTGKYLNIDNYLDINIKIINFNGHGASLAHNYSFISENKVVFSEFDYVVKDYFKNDNNNSTYTLNFTEYDSFKNIMGTENSSILTINFSFCDPYKTKDCKIDSNFFRTNPVIMFWHIDFNIDSLNYKQPIKPYIKSSLYSLNRNSAKYVTYYFIKSSYESDNGWMLEDKFITNFYTKLNKDVDIKIFDSNAGNLDCLGIILSSNQLHNKVIRSYMKVQELFAKIGGIANAVLIIVKILSYHYLRFIYLSFIRKNSFVDMADENKQLSECNSIIKNNNINNNQNRQSIYNNSSIFKNKNLHINNTVNFNLNNKEVIEFSNNNYNPNLVISHKLENQNIKDNYCSNNENDLQKRKIYSSIYNDQLESNCIFKNKKPSIENKLELNSNANFTNKFSSPGNKERNNSSCEENNNNIANSDVYFIKNNNNSLLNKINEINQNKLENNSEINNNSKVNAEKYISSKQRIHSLIKSDVIIETLEKELSYFKYLLSYMCGCFYNNNLKKIYNSEFQKVKDLLDIRLFKLFLIKSYYEKFKFKYY